MNLIVVNIYKHAFTFWHRPGSNPGPFDPKSDNLTTTPPNPNPKHYYRLIGS